MWYKQRSNTDITGTPEDTAGKDENGRWITLLARISKDKTNQKSGMYITRVEECRMLIPDDTDEV